MFVFASNSFRAGLVGRSIEAGGLWRSVSGEIVSAALRSRSAVMRLAWGDVKSRYPRTTPIKIFNILVVFRVDHCWYSSGICLCSSTQLL